jgi:hypothetical protein
LDAELVSFIESFEPSENWGFRHIDSHLLDKSLLIASQINHNIQVVPKISVDTWVLFIALLPYTNSLDVIADLCDIIPNFLTKIIQNNSSSPSVISARQLCLDRLNILVRLPLHKTVFTKDTINVINGALKAFNGIND